MDVSRIGLVCALLLAGTSAGCSRPDPRGELVARGEFIFFTETFAGNGRTCGSCHRPDNNFTIDAAFIATLPPRDPLFVAEFNPALADLERPDLMRKFGLILENQDGFDKLETRFNLRGVPHTQALATSIESTDGPRTGWSGDGAPGDGSLRAFATGAVIQHFTKSLERIPGVDFRLPEDGELDALDAFQRSIGRQADLKLPLPLVGEVPTRGQEIFLDDTLGKCNICHVNAGATANLGGRNVGNRNFNTGVEDLPDQPARLTGQLVPRDDGLGTPGDGTFSTPPLVEAADTSPFFHNGSVQTIEGAVGFYDGESFNNSPAGQILAQSDPDGEGIELDATQIVAVAAFLRVINALESIRMAIDLLERSHAGGSRTFSPKDLRQHAGAEIQDAIDVLACAGLSLSAVAALGEAAESAGKGRVKSAITALRAARAELIVE